MAADPETGTMNGVGEDDSELSKRLGRKPTEFSVKATGADDGLGLSAREHAATAPTVLLIKATDPKRNKARIHLDLCPTGRDQATEVERLLAASAVRVGIGQGETPWIVLAEPCGTEFCVMPKVIAPEPEPYHHLAE